MIVFWAAFLCGQAVGILFDFFRALRKNIHHHSLGVALEDIVFCTISFRLFFDICYATNNGSLRWYIFASFICSIILYFCSVSKFIILLWSFVLNIFKKILCPFIKFAGFLLKKFKTAFLKTKKSLNYTFDNIKNFLSHFIQKRNSQSRKKN